MTLTDCVTVSAHENGHAMQLLASISALCLRCALLLYQTESKHQCQDSLPGDTIKNKKIEYAVLKSNSYYLTRQQI